MKDIRGYEGRYKISRNGEVWCYPNPQTGYKWQKKTPYISQRGYLVVNLYIGQKCRAFAVHRLVTFAYIKNPQSKKYVNHKDGNKLNPNAENLEWATAKENYNHAIANNLWGQDLETVKRNRQKNGRKTGGQNGKKSRRRFTFEEAENIRKIHEIGGFSRLKISQIYGCSSKTIDNICNYKSYKEI